MDALGPSPQLRQVWEAYCTVRQAFDQGELRGRSARELQAWAQRTNHVWAVSAVRRFLAGSPFEDTPRLLLAAYRHDLETNPRCQAALLWTRCALASGDQVALPEAPWRAELARYLT